MVGRDVDRAQFRVDRPPAQQQRALLHVPLGVPRVHPDRVQFQQLPRVVLVRLLAGRARPVEVGQHRRVEGAGQQHRLEVAEGMLADHIALIGVPGDEGAAGRVRREHVQVVGPEVDHHLEHLTAAEDRPAQVISGQDKLIVEVVLGRGRLRGGALQLRPELLQRLDPGVGDLAGLELPFQPLARAQALHLRRRGGGVAVGGATEQQGGGEVAVHREATGLNGGRCAARLFGLHGSATRTGGSRCPGVGCRPGATAGDVRGLGRVRLLQLRGEGHAVRLGCGRRLAERLQRQDGGDRSSRDPGAAGHDHVAAGEPAVLVNFVALDPPGPPGARRRRRQLVHE